MKWIENKWSIKSKCQRIPFSPSQNEVESKGQKTKIEQNENRDKAKKIGLK